MEAVQLNIIDAIAARDAGMQQAMEHADRESPKWSQRAYAMLIDYMKEHPGEFMTEDVRIWAEKRGFDTPPDARAWGGVVRSAAGSKIIRCVRIQPQRDAKSHRSPKNVWEPVKLAA